MECSLKELSGILGISERQIRSLRNEHGILNPASSGGRGRKCMYRLEQCVPEYIRFKVAGVTEGGKGLVREREQAEHERIKKKISEIKLRRLKRELHEAKDVENFLTDMLVAFRARLITIPQKLAPLVIAETDANHVRDMIESEIFEAIEELSEYDPLKIDHTGTMVDGEPEDDDVEEDEEEDDD
jgi:DNA-binding transcriptional MerR regulator